MFPRRWMVVAAGVLLVIVVLFVLPGMQQSAWTQGYLVGRLSAGGAGTTGGADALLPYMYGGGFRGPHFGGFGGFFGVFLLLMMFFVAARVFGRCARGMGWHGPEGRGEGPHGAWHGRGPGSWGRPEEGPGTERPGERATETSRTGLV